MTSIVASHTIIPNECTPKRRLCMSQSDHLARSVYATSVYIYKGNHHNQNTFERLRDSLGKILVHYYPIAGRLNRVEDGGFEVNCNAKGVMLFEAESTKKLDDYRDFSPNGPIKELIPTVDYSQPIEEIPLLFVQLTKFQGGKQGLALGVAVSHRFVDGVAAISFINSWAKVARGETLEQHEMCPFLDREILNFPQPPSTPLFDHPEFKSLPLLLGNFDFIKEMKKETTCALFKLTPIQVENLKNKANDGEIFKEGSRGYTTYEAIVAHIWKSASKARQLDDLQESVVHIVVDIRRRLNPPLPSNFFGNAIVPTFTTRCQVGEINANPLSYGSHLIKEAIEMITNEYIRSQFNWLMGLENDKESENNLRFYGNPNINVTSWLGMPVYGGDFGWGKPVYFGPGSLNSDGRAFVMKSSEGDGSVIILICLQIQHMQLFNKFFYEDI